MVESKFKMAAELRSQIKSEFPGTQVPDMQRDDETYRRWWRKMAMWAYKFGPILVEVVDGKSSRD